MRKARTDPAPLPADPAGLEGRPEARNLVGIYAAVTGETVEQVLARFAGQGFGAFKPALADALVALIARCGARLERFAPIQRNWTGSGQGRGKGRELGAPTLAAAYPARSA